MGSRKLFVFFILIGSCLGWEVGAKLGTVLPIGGFETFNRTGISGILYGAVGEKIQCELELGYTGLSGKYQGYQLSLTNLNLEVGYPIIQRTNSSVGIIAGAGALLVARGIGVHRESGPAVLVNCGGRFQQREERLQFKVDLVPVLLTDGQGWAAVFCMRFGVGYEL